MDGQDASGESPRLTSRPTSSGSEPEGLGASSTVAPRVTASEPRFARHYSAPLVATSAWLMGCGGSADDLLTFDTSTVR